MLERGDELPAGAAEVERRALARPLGMTPDDQHAGRTREVDAERGGARAQGQQVALLGRLERLLQQRGLHRLLLVAHDVAEAGHGREQRRRRLGGRLGDPPREARARGGQHEPARGLIGARRDRRGDRVPVVDVQLRQSRLQGAHLPASDATGARPATISGSPSAVRTITPASRKAASRSTTARSGSGIRSASTR